MAKCGENVKKKNGAVVDNFKEDLDVQKFFLRGIFNPVKAAKRNKKSHRVLTSPMQDTNLEFVNMILLSRLSSYLRDGQNLV